MKLAITDLLNTMSGEFDNIRLYTKSESEYKAFFQKLTAHLNLSTMLRISWPKVGKLNTDLSMPKVINIGHGLGLVESTC